MPIELTAADRCDSCGAQAWTRVWVAADKSELLFCKHHFERNEAKFRELDYMWVDDRAKINAKLDVSA